MQRDEPLRQLRPPIPTESTADSPAEQFQNQTLRPILKLQNELLLRLYRQYLHKRKQPLMRLSAREQTDYITHSVQQDQKFRNLLVGLVVGQFTLPELEQFLADEAELTRRLASLVAQRLTTQLDRLR